MPNSNDGLIEHVNLKFTTSEKCPLCNNVIRVDIRDEAQYNKLTSAVKDNFLRFERRAIRFAHLRHAREHFWTFFIYLLFYTGFSFFMDDCFHTLVIMTVLWGIIYVAQTTIHFLLERRAKNKALQDEIEELTNE